MKVIPETTKSYIAGFLDGDGCIMYQLIRRKDYVYGFQIRASIVFYQKTTNRAHLEWLKQILEYGYIRDRNDGMSEYTIVGLKPVKEILKLLQPYVALKRGQIQLALKIDARLEGGFELKKLLRAAELVDQFKTLNYSKRRINASAILKEFLQQHELIPRND